jgi:hypothetical protein
MLGSAASQILSASEVLPSTGCEGSAAPEPSSGAARPEDRFEDVVDELVGSPGVTPPRGSSGLAAGWPQCPALEG